MNQIFKLDNPHQSKNTCARTHTPRANATFEYIGLYINVYICKTPTRKITLLITVSIVNSNRGADHRASPDTIYYILVYLVAASSVVASKHRTHTHAPHTHTSHTKTSYCNAR